MSLANPVETSFNSSMPYVENIASWSLSLDSFPSDNESVSQDFMRT